MHTHIRQKYQFTEDPLSCLCVLRMCGIYIFSDKRIHLPMVDMNISSKKNELTLTIDKSIQSNPIQSHHNVLTFDRNSVAHLSFCETLDFIKSHSKAIRH